MQEDSNGAPSKKSSENIKDRLRSCSFEDSLHQDQEYGMPVQRALLANSIDVEHDSSEMQNYEHTNDTYQYKATGVGSWRQSLPATNEQTMSQQKVKQVFEKDQVLTNKFNHYYK